MGFWHGICSLRDVYCVRLVVRGGMSRVLLVDDEKNVLKTLTIGLRRRGYVVQQARSGFEALRILEEESYDFVVSDVRMFPMDGYTLASHVRERYPEVSVVLISAYGFEEEKSGREAPVISRLTKPFSVTELVEVLEEERQKRQESRGKRVLVVGETKVIRGISDVLEEEGFRVDVLAPGANVEKRLKRVAYDLFLIDESLLNGKKWKILNEIDQHASTKPVIVLTNNGGKKDAVAASDLATAVLDKQAFFENRSWAVAFLRDNMVEVGSEADGS